MTFLETVSADLMTTMKVRSEDPLHAIRLSTLRLMKTALERYVKDQRKPLDEKAAQQILNTMLKQRREAAEAFRKGNRLELAEKEELELKVIETYMPQEATEAEVDAAIEAAVTSIKADPTPGPIVKKMGLIMKLAQSNLAGKRVDGKVLSQKIMTRIS